MRIVLRRPSGGGSTVMALLLASALAGCQPKVHLMPTPVALTTGEFDLFDGIAPADQDTRLPVLYATNRVPLSTADARVCFDLCE